MSEQVRDPQVERSARLIAEWVDAHFALCVGGDSRVRAAAEAAVKLVLGIQLDTKMLDHPESMLSELPGAIVEAVRGGSDYNEMLDELIPDDQNGEE